MPKPAAPPPPPPENPNLVKYAGQREAFDAPAVALAEKLGWFGEPNWVTNGIAVVDAQNYIGKTMHEHFAANALKQERPDVATAAMHLGLEDAAEIAMLEMALDLAYEDGADAVVNSTDKIIVAIGAENFKPAAGLLGSKVEG
jgi:hypothetical protein